MMWLYHKNWLHSPLSLCLHLHKCLTRVSFTPGPPPARDQKMVARKMRYGVWRNALAFFYIPKTASPLDFFDRDHTYYIAFLHWCIRLHDLNVKPKIYWWLKGSKWISCAVQGHPVWILRGMRSLRSESAVTHEEKTNSLCNPGGTEVSLRLGFGILSDVSERNSPGTFTLTRNRGQGIENTPMVVKMQK